MCNLTEESNANQYLACHLLVDGAQSFEEHSSLLQNYVAFVVCLSNVWRVEMHNKDVPCLRWFNVTAAKEETVCKLRLQEAKKFLQKNKKDLGMACHIPPLKKAKKQGEMTLPSVGPIPLKKCRI